MTYALLSFADLYHRTHFSIFQETTELSVSFILATQAGNDSQFPPKDLVDGNVGQDFFSPHMEFFFPHKTGVRQILFFLTLQRLTSQLGNVTERVQAEAKSLLN